MLEKGPHSTVDRLQLEGIRKLLSTQWEESWTREAPFEELIDKIQEKAPTVFYYGPGRAPASQLQCHSVPIEHPMAQAPLPPASLRRLLANVLECWLLRGGTLGIPGGSMWAPWGVPWGFRGGPWGVPGGPGEPKRCQGGSFKRTASVCI